MTEQRYQEARQVGALLTAALMFIGATSAVSAFASWLETATLSPGQALANGARFATEALARMRPRRKAARDITIAAYRLIMALRTGATLNIVGEHEEGPTTLQQLRREFHELVLEHAPAALQSDAEPPTLPEVPEETDRRSTDDQDAPERMPEGVVDGVLWEEPEAIPLWDVSDWSDDSDIEAELIRLAEIEAAELAEQERLFEEEMRRVAAEEYRVLLQRKQEEARLEQKDQDTAREEQRHKQGRKLAAIEEMHVRNGNRRAQEQLLEQDKGAIGVARYSPGGCCAFCGVLILNSPHMKKPYPMLSVHPNCDCEYVSLYLPSDYDNDSRFDWNRYLVQAYDAGAPNRNKKANGNEYLNALRRHLYQRRKLARS